MESIRNGSDILSQSINRWVVGHSFLTLAASSVVISMNTLMSLLVSGILSFSILILIGLKHLSINRLVGPANLITASRLGAVLLVTGIAPNLSNSLILAMGLVLMLLDCLDGWLARRMNTASLWGEFFDKETDAYFLLVVCLAAFQRLLAGWEILVIGLLRYIFVISLLILKRKPKKEKRSLRAQNVFTIVMLLLLSLFSPFDFPRFAFVVLALFLVLFSFGSDFRKIIAGS